MYFILYIIAWISIILSLIIGILGMCLFVFEWIKQKEITPILVDDFVTYSIFIFFGASVAIALKYENNNYVQFLVLVVMLAGIFLHEQIRCFFVNIGNKCAIKINKYISKEKRIGL